MYSKVATSQAYHGRRDFASVLTNDYDVPMHTPSPLFQATASILCAASSLAHAQQTPEPFGACPTRAQVEWHRLEFYAFIHFGANTFTNREWGSGSESPEIIAPTQLDCEQWADVAKSAGMRGVILTAKHHDGLCLWPTKTTEHNISRSPVKIDIVGELSRACRERELLFGVYLSPWDRNSALYGQPQYIDLYREQLRELLTSYGPIFEVWHDGANGGSGYYGGANEERKIDKLTYYDWPNTWKMIAELQPDAIIFSDAGPGCRWAGNERGHSAETSWQTIDNAGRMPGLTYDDLASGKEGGTHWVGVEADVSIRPGWFYHPEEDDKVKTAEELLDIWFRSVGCGANLILNLPPDRRGLIHENDRRSLERLGTILRSTFSDNMLARTARVGDDDEAQKMLDGDQDTFGSILFDSTRSTTTFTSSSPMEFDVIRIEEAISLGQRVRDFSVSIRHDQTWRKIAGGTTIGPRRVIRLAAPVVASEIRFEFESLAPVCVSEIGLYKLNTNTESPR